jgi:hypothetical protein
MQTIDHRTIIQKETKKGRLLKGDATL